MSPKKSKTRSNGASTSTSGRKSRKQGNGVSEETSHRRVYNRTTPVGRALKHVTKAKAIASFVLSRMLGWEHSGEPKLLSALGKIRVAHANLLSAEVDIEKLFEKNWLPPEKLGTVRYDVGDAVRISDRHARKYLHIYEANIIESLVVSQVFPSGEVAVKHGKEAAFIVPRLHLQRKAEL